MPESTISTTCCFKKFGFETKILSEQTFNVVCVTKRNEQKETQTFHHPIKGEAKVRAMLETAHNGVVLAHTEVEFNGGKYNLTYVRNGLSGDALVIGIQNFDEPEYTEWDLYTDTPSAAADHNRVVTPEQLRERAETAARW